MGLIPKMIGKTLLRSPDTLPSGDAIEVYAFNADGEYVPASSFPTEEPTSGGWWLNGGVLTYAQPFVPVESYLIIAAGESNSGGYAPNGSASSEELAARSVLPIWNVNTNTFQSLDIGTNNNLDHAGLDSTTHGIELELANIVASGRFGSTPVYYLQTGQGSSNIQDWLEGSATGFWTKFVNRYNAAAAVLGGVFTPVVFYSQGINDALGNNLWGGAGATTNPATWKTRTIAHLAKIRTLIGATTLIVMTKFKDSVYPTFNAAIDEIAADDPYTVVIQTDDIAGVQWQGDNNHLTYIGTKEMCNRFVDEIFTDSATAPVIDPDDGQYATAQTVTIAGTSVRYTTNGRDPHIGTSYSGSFSATPPVVVRARAYAANKKSTLATASYSSPSSITWSTEDATAGSLTLSNVDADVINSAAIWKTCRVSGAAKSSGKYYIEFKVATGAGDANFMFGFCNSSFAVSSYLATSNHSCAFWALGPSFTNAFTAGSGANIVVSGPIENDVHMLAIDFDAGKLWLGQNNSWFNSGNPGTGANPALNFTPATAGAMWPAMSLYQGGGKWRVQANSAQQSYSPPSGFSSWGA